MATGDPMAADSMASCPLCGQTYYILQGHTCPTNFRAVYNYNQVPDSMIAAKLDRVIELLERILAICRR